jgi:hypothetical protein
MIVFQFYGDVLVSPKILYRLLNNEVCPGVRDTKRQQKSRKHERLHKQKEA